MAVKPITPDEVEDIQATEVPDDFWELVNKLLSREWDGASSVVTKQMIKRRYTATLDGVWFSAIPRAYRKSGWRVDVDGGSYKFSRKAPMDGC